MVIAKKMFRESARTVLIFRLRNLLGTACLFPFRPEFRAFARIASLCLGRHRANSLALRADHRVVGPSASAVVPERSLDICPLGLYSAPDGSHRATRARLRILDYIITILIDGI